MASQSVHREEDLKFYRIVNRLATRAARAAMSATNKVEEVAQAQRSDDPTAIRDSFRSAMVKVTEAFEAEAVAVQAKARITEPGLVTKASYELAEAHDEVERAVDAVIEIRRIAVFGKHHRTNDVPHSHTRSRPAIRVVS